jgi:hypothetical protein
MHMKEMNSLLKLEEIAQFLGAIFIFSQLHFAWWVFPACLLLPDLSMVGYLAGPKLGAWVYNFFHHKGLALLVLVSGFWLANPILQLAGIILFAHAAMDRIFGYGLKHEEGFQHTHLGKIGK